LFLTSEIRHADQKPYTAILLCIIFVHRICSR
jgi:hypothetical protein